MEFKQMTKALEQSVRGMVSRTTAKIDQMTAKALWHLKVLKFELFDKVQLRCILHIEAILGAGVGGGKTINSKRFQSNHAKYVVLRMGTV